MRIENIFESEGINPQDFNVRVNDQDLHTASIYLFHFILNPEDARWNLVKYFLETKRREKFKPMNLENALLATYLSKTPSFRNQYGMFCKEEHIRHLCRALNNLRAYGALRSAFESFDPEIPERFEITFLRTEKITTIMQPAPVRACPEALYQFRLFCDQLYIGRVGFNVHPEQGNLVFSLVNIQGMVDGCETYAKLGVLPLNTLVRNLLKFAASLNTPCEVRGLKNPRHSESAPLYNSVLRAEKVKRYSFDR